MSLTVLAIGMLGIVALQGTTVRANQEAHQFATAAAITKTWIQRLERDAQRWNHPSPQKPSTDDLASDTFWLGAAVNNADRWFRPISLGAEGIHAAFDRDGKDLPPNDPNAIYCTHVRLRRVYPDLIKAEVRVFWTKARLVDGGKFFAAGLGNGICSTDGNEEAIGGDDANLHWSYAVAGIQKARAL